MPSDRIQTMDHDLCNFVMNIYSTSYCVSGQFAAVAVIDCGYLLTDDCDIHNFGYLCTKNPTTHYSRINKYFKGTWKVDMN